MLHGLDTSFLVAAEVPSQPDYVAGRATLCTVNKVSATDWPWRRKGAPGLVCRQAGE